MKEISISWGNSVCVWKAHPVSWLYSVCNTHRNESKKRFVTLNAQLPGSMAVVTIFGGTGPLPDRVNMHSSVLKNISFFLSLVPVWEGPGGGVARGTEEGGVRVLVSDENGISVWLCPKCVAPLYSVKAGCVCV